MPTRHHSTAPTPHSRPARWLRGVAACFAVGIGTFAGAALAPANADAATLDARAAGAFRDSIGVQTHFGFTGYAYDTASTGELAAMLRTLGVRHLRDDLCLNSEQACVRIRSRLGAMRDALGPGAPSVDLLAGYTRELASVADRATRDADIERALTAATNAPLAPMLAGLEPVNEPDLKQTAGWQAATLADDATFQRLLAEPRFAALRGVPHLSPAIGHAENTAALLASGWSSDRADVGNFHPYPPAWGGPEHGLTVRCGTMTALDCARQLGRAAAPIATESGYTTAGNALSTSWVSERAQAIYLPRLLLENFRAGVARTYLYELVDLKPSRSSAVEGYGLWRAQSTRAGIAPADAKPAALAISRMNATIGDLGATAGPAALDVAIRADGRDIGDDAVRRVLLHRADGSYVLALWQPKSVWNNAIFQQRDHVVADLPVDVTVGGASWAVSATRPSASAGETGRWTSVSTLRVPVGADVTLLELRATGAAPVTTAADVATAAPSDARTNVSAPKAAHPQATRPRGAAAAVDAPEPADTTRLAWQVVAKRGAIALSHASRGAAARAHR